MEEMPSVPYSTNRKDITASQEGFSVVSVRSYTMEGSVDPPWQLSTTTYHRVTATFVEITLECGAVGWGECLVREAAGATRAIVDDVLAPILIGKDARRVQALWDEM